MMTLQQFFRLAGAALVLNALLFGFLSIGLLWCILFLWYHHKGDRVQLHFYKSMGPFVALGTFIALFIAAFAYSVDRWEWFFHGWSTGIATMALIYIVVWYYAGYMAEKYGPPKL